MKGKRYTIKAYIEPKRQKGIIILIIIAMKTEVISLHSETRNWKNVAMICFLKQEGQYSAAGLHWFYRTGCECLPSRACVLTEERSSSIHTSDPNPRHETDEVLLINCRTLLTIASRYAQTHLLLSNLGHFLV